MVKGNNKSFGISQTKQIRMPKLQVHHSKDHSDVR